MRTNATVSATSSKLARVERHPVDRPSQGERLRDLTELLAVQRALPARELAVPHGPRRRARVPRYLALLARVGDHVEAQVLLTDAAAGLARALDAEQGDPGVGRVGHRADPRVELAAR